MPGSLEQNHSAPEQAEAQNEELNFPFKKSTEKYTPDFDPSKHEADLKYLKTLEQPYDMSAFTEWKISFNERENLIQVQGENLSDEEKDILRYEVRAIDVEPILNARESIDSMMNRFDNPELKTAMLKNGISQYAFFKRNYNRYTTLDKHLTEIKKDDENELFQQVIAKIANKNDINTAISLTYEYIDQKQEDADKEADKALQDID